MLIGWYLFPLSYKAFKELQYYIKDNYASILLQEGVFVRPNNEMTVYINERAAGGKLYGIMVHDERDPQKPVTVYAKEGTIINGSSGPIFALKEGTREQYNHRTGVKDNLQFASYSIEMADYYKELKRQRFLSVKERFLPQLFWPEEGVPEKLERKSWAEGHFRLAWPFANIVLLLIAAVPFLSGQYSRRGEGKKLLLASICGVGYIVLQFMLVKVTEKHSMLFILQHLSVLVVLSITLFLLLRSPAKRVQKEA